MARTLARQFLGWQLGIVAVLLVAVAGLAVEQSNAAFRETQGRRMLSVAEDVAATASVRESLAVDDYEPLPALGTSARNLSGADEIVIVDRNLVVRSAADPAAVGEPFAVGASTAPTGRAWAGNPDGSTVVAHVPVLDDDGRVAGLVAARAEAPSLVTGLTAAPAPAAALLGLTVVLGVAGSLLLARRVRRQTLGLEPAEIVELVQRREAMLLGVKEGVLGLDGANRITLHNAAAADLLGIDGSGDDRPGAELELGDRLRDVLTGAAVGEDQVVLHGNRVLVLNRMPVVVDRARVGAVVTLRDRTELAALEHRLDASRHVTDTLRAQAHEFTNRLHTIAGLTELGEYPEVRRFVAGIVAGTDQWHREVTSTVGDTAVAALLVAKASLATERGAQLRLAPGSRLDAVDAARDPALSADLVTVLGNLVDNALDAAVPTGAVPNTAAPNTAAAGVGPGWVEIELGRDGDLVRVAVRDSGPGVASELVEEVFRHGFSTKAAERDTGGRGLGLAIARQICLRRGGSITLQNGGGRGPDGIVGGAVFVATLPLLPVQVRS